MSEPLRGVIVSHSAVAQALRAAVAAITGIGDALVPVSNDGCDSGALTTRLAEAIGGPPPPPFVRPPGGPRPPPPRPPPPGPPGGPPGAAGDIPPLARLPVFLP